MIYDFAVIGGGASGLAAAVTAARSGERVIIIEAGPALGRKILASGNGRCNLLNSGTPRYYGDARFSEEVLKRCGYEAQTRFWHSIGLITAEDDGHRVYPCTFQSSTVMDALKTALQLCSVKILLNAPVDDCRRDSCHVFYLSAGGETIAARRILIATGGPAGKKDGAERSGYRMLQNFGHTVFPLRPALVPLVTDRKSISGLSGIRIRCGIKLIDRGGTSVHQERGELLFTDYGVSGICVMQCGRFVDGNGYSLELDLLEKIIPDDGALMEELRRRKAYFSSMPPDTLLTGLLPKKLAYAVMKQAGAAMRGEILENLEDQFLESVIRSIRHYRIEVYETKGLEDAQVTAGGADCREFSPDNMESRLVRGLYAAGEIMNTDGDCGGFNLMFAFGTGILAGLNGRTADIAGGGMPV